MVQRPNNPFKRLAIDILGFTLILAAGLFSWIPGPGGIPLLIAGLSILSINHDWAKRWQDKAREGGLNLTNKIFVDHPFAKWAFDIIGIGLMILAAYILNVHTRNLFRTMAISAGFLGLGLLLGNRKRLQRIVRTVKRKN